MDLGQLEAGLLDELERKGWTIERSTSREPLLPHAVSQRYPRLPPELVAFLEKLGSAVNADETVWFLCREDYRRTGGEAFRWNEFELMVSEDAEAEQQARIRKFWDRHFPFALAVHSDYDYLAASLGPAHFGAIVHGCGPDFEETSVIAPSFAEFLRLHREAAAGRRDEWPLSSFV